MQGQVAWVTGSASGVGRRLTGALLQRGCRVLACDLDDAALGAAATSDGWPEDRLQRAAFDVSDAAAWDRAAEDLAEWGRLDYLFNVAGYLRPGYVAETPREQIDRHIDINVKGLMYGSQLAAQRMVAQGSGHIVNISSLAGVAAIPGLTLYSASKFAVRGFSLALANELREHGVYVTVICPDAIQTPMLDLQVDYPEAALTFSGSGVLTVADIERAVFEQVLPRRPMEVLLPAGRGLLARFAGAVPALGSGLLDRFRARGLRRQRQLSG